MEGPEVKKPPSPSSYKDCEIFQKVVKLKDGGMVVYCHKTRRDNVIRSRTGSANLKTSAPSAVSIAENTRHADLTSSLDDTSSIDKVNIICPRCRSLMEHAQKLSLRVPPLNKSDVMGVCDHCRLKTLSDKTEEVKKSMPTSDEHSEDIKRNVKMWLNKMKYITQGSVTPDKRKTVKTSYSDIKLDHQESRTSIHEPEVKPMFHSETLKVDTTDKDNITIKIKDVLSKSVAFGDKDTFAVTPYEEGQITTVTESPSVVASDAVKPYEVYKATIKPSLQSKQELKQDDVPTISLSFEDMDINAVLKKMHDLTLRQIVKQKNERPPTVTHSVHKHEISKSGKRTKEAQNIRTIDDKLSKDFDHKSESRIVTRALPFDVKKQNELQYGDSTIDSKLPAAKRGLSFIQKSKDKFLQDTKHEYSIDTHPTEKHVTDEKSTTNKKKYVQTIESDDNLKIQRVPQYRHDREKPSQSVNWKEIPESNKMVSELKNEISSSKKEFSEIEKDISEGTPETKKEKAGSKKQISESKKEIHDRKKEISKGHIVISESKKELFVRSKKIREAIKEIALTKKVTPESVKSTPESKKGTPESKKEIHASKKETAKSKIEISESKKEIHENIKDIPKSIIKISESKREIQEHKKGIQERKKELPKSKIRISEIEKETLESKKEISETKKHIDESVKDISEIKKGASDTKKQVPESKKQSPKSKKEILESSIQLTESKRQVGLSKIKGFSYFFPKEKIKSKMSKMRVDSSELIKTTQEKLRKQIEEDEVKLKKKESPKEEAKLKKEQLSRDQEESQKSSDRYIRSDRETQKKLLQKEFDKENVFEGENEIVKGDGSQEIDGKKGENIRSDKQSRETSGKIKLEAQIQNDGNKPINIENLDEKKSKKYESPEGKKSKKYESPEDKKSRKYDSLEDKKSRNYESPEWKKSRNYESPELKRSRKYDSLEDKKSGKYESLEEEKKSRKYTSLDDKGSGKYKNLEEKKTRKYDSLEGNKPGKHGNLEDLLKIYKNQDEKKKLRKYQNLEDKKLRPYENLEDKDRIKYKNLEELKLRKYGNLKSGLEKTSNKGEDSTDRGAMFKGYKGKLEEQNRYNADETRNKKWDQKSDPWRYKILEKKTKRAVRNVQDEIEEIADKNEKEGILKHKDYEMHWKTKKDTILKPKSEHIIVALEEQDRLLKELEDLKKALENEPENIREGMEKQNLLSELDKLANQRMKELADAKNKTPYKLGQKRSLLQQPSVMLREQFRNKLREIELKFNQVKLVKMPSDDLILRLVKLRQSARQQKSSNKADNLYLDLDRDILISHKKHAKSAMKIAECTLCNDSELELDIESLRNRRTRLKKKRSEIIVEENIYAKNMAPLVEGSEEYGICPILFKMDEDLKYNQDQSEEKETEVLNEKSPEIKATEKPDNKGVIRYQLSDRTFIEKGWTMLPTEKIVQKINIYRMRPARPEFDWFEHNKNKRVMTYDTGETLAEFDDDGRGRWYYKNGTVALEYYDAEEINAQQRIIVFSNGERDDRGRSRPRTILASFDYLGNGIVFDHSGKIRLKYNQTEGVVLDRDIGPVSHWKWHALNDPPVLQQVMIDTQLSHKDPVIVKLGTDADNVTRLENEDMLAIEFDNFIKEKSKKLSQKFKPFQIKMKALKINENFSLKVLDQATVYLMFRDGLTSLKLNIGMILDHKEIVDTDTQELGEVSNSIERFPARTDSLARLQQSVAHAQHYERQRAERERRIHPPTLVTSEDKMTAAASPPSRPPFTTLPVDVTSSFANCKCKRPSNNLFYSNRLF